MITYTAKNADYRCKNCITAKGAERARSYTREAIETLAELMRSSKDERVRGTAAQALLDRGWGKPKVEVVADGAGSYVEALRLINEQIETDQSAYWRS